MKYSIFSAQEKWHDIIQRQAASGLSVSRYCQRHRVAESSFFAWKRRLGSTAVRPVFLEAKITNTKAVPQCHGIELRLRGGRIVRVRRGFDPRLLADLIGTLEGLA